MLEMLGVAAMAASPEARGRNLDRTLHLLDGGGGSIDPAFAAHILPIKAWATASWEGWLKRDELETAFCNASS